MKGTDNMDEQVEVKMNVQTMYKGELLRAGKSYKVNKETAERWLISGLAENPDNNI